MATQPSAAVAEVVVEEEPSEPPLKYKTWSLKVSVHCEGCKRKVKKILLGMEGVYTVDVDTKLHKTTVTGNVDPETLIKKLEKSGKHAELWPEKTEQKESKKSKKKKNKPNDQDEPESNNNDDSPPTEPEKLDPNKGEGTGPPSKVVEIVNSAKPGGSVQVKEVRVEMKKPENQPAGENQQPPENKPSEAAGNGGNAGGGGGGGGKKKKKKSKGNGGNGNANGNSNGGDPGAPAGGGNGEDGPPPPQGQEGPPPEYRGPPRSFPMYEHPPPPYYAPPTATPVYAVSYNTAYPASSYTASYYANPAPYSYAYVHQGSDSAESGPTPSDSFEIFSDENPNACAVM